MALHTITPGFLKYDSEYTLATRVLHGATKREWDDHDDSNTIEICLKTLRHFIPESKIIVEHTTVCDVASSVAEVMAAELTVHIATNVVKLFVKIHVVL